VHVHGIGKKKNVSIINWDMLKENKEEQKKIIQYLDSLVITINPNINVAVPKRHLCQKG